LREVYLYGEGVRQTVNTGLVVKDVLHDSVMIAAPLLLIVGFRVKVGGEDQKGYKVNQKEPTLYR
jgi:hypothetical protein